MLHEQEFKKDERSKMVTVILVVVFIMRGEKRSKILAQ